MTERRVARVVVVAPLARRRPGYPDEVRRRASAISAGAPVRWGPSAGAADAASPSARPAARQGRPLAVLVARPAKGRRRLRRCADAAQPPSGGASRSARSRPRRRRRPSAATGPPSPPPRSRGCPWRSPRLGGERRRPRSGTSWRPRRAPTSPTLVRACWPGALAPRLVSSRLRLQLRGGAALRRRRRGRLRDASESAAGRLRLWGFPARPLTLAVAAGRRRSLRAASTTAPGSRRRGSPWRATWRCRRGVVMSGDARAGSSWCCGTDVGGAPAARRGETCRRPQVAPPATTRRPTPGEAPSSAHV